MTAISKIEELVLDSLCAACSLDRGTLDRRASLADLGLDSVNLAALVSRVEAACGLTFSQDRILSLFDCTHVDDLLERLPAVVAGATPTARAPA